MKVQWTIKDSSADWVFSVCRIAGFEPGSFVDRLIRYHAGVMDAQEEAVFIELMEVVGNVVEYEEGA